MQLSLHSDYALRILMALAVDDRKLSVDDIAGKYGISRNHLAKIANRLQAEGLVQTFRGRGGGMRLARPAAEIIVGDVVRRFENFDGFVGCFAAGPGCVVDGLCALKPALAGALQAFLAHLDTFCLSDLVPAPAAFGARLDRKATSAEAAWQAT